ncbi:MAG: AAA family ATPase, partial [Chloroflexi bacterium]|nr:AAA family ATPase [Chloroflexota bacterium]
SKATQGIIGILAGSPGTGKTYCTAQMIGEIIKSVGDDRIAACAPTGKAAVRLTESLAKEGIDLQATTIHRMLKVEVAPGGAWSFTHNSGNLLPYRYIFVDESSMLDTDLMASLLSARAVGCHVLFVGDPNQLSPVGHGAPLRDMIAAGLPCGMLTEIQRNSGRIVKVCAEIRDTHTFTPSATLDIKGGENLVVLERSNANAQRTALRNILMQLAAGREYDPVWDCQVLCAVNKKSPLARRTLNAELQGLLNPNGKQITGNRFRINDKIICLKNSWLPAADDNDPLANEDGKIYVANGEMGRVLDITPALTVAELESPKRIIKIPKGQSNDDDSDDATDTGCNWDLGYAVSTHKSQGSQWKIVIPMIDSSPAARRVCTREWIYTAFSRAEDACIAIGQKAVAREFCKRSGLGVRKTFLQEDIELWKGSHAPKNTPKQNQLLPAGT